MWLELEQFHSSLPSQTFTISFPFIHTVLSDPNPPPFIQNILFFHLPQHSLTLFPPSLPSFSLCSASVLLWGIHRVGILQRHRVSDGLWRPLSKVDRVSRLRHAVPGPRAGRPQLLQEPRSRIKPLVFLQTKLRSHRMGLLRLSPGYDHRSQGWDWSRTIYNFFHSTALKQSASRFRRKQKALLKTPTELGLRLTTQINLRGCEMIKGLGKKTHFCYTKLCLFSLVSVKSLHFSLWDTL